MPSEPSSWLAALRHVHDRAAGEAAKLDSTEVRHPSYCSGWNVAQVYSHLGSQAEIYTRLLEAGLEQHEPLSNDAYPAIWDAWKSRRPEDQVTDSVAYNEELIRRLEGLDAIETASFHVRTFRRELDIAELESMRLSEYALHEWDVRFAFDPTATLDEQAVPLLLSRLTHTVARTGKPLGRSLTVVVTTSQPEESFALVLDGVRLEPLVDQRADGTLHLEAEALIRLVYGRIDPAHIGSVELDAPSLDLDDLRNVFPGL